MTMLMSRFSASHRKIRHDDVMSESTTRSQVVRLSDLVVAVATIRNRRFEDCLILGPAVVAVTGSSNLENCTFEGEKEALLWEIAPDRIMVIGAIELADCSFIGCRFQGVGFAGNAEFIEHFRNNIGSEAER